jgi:hypothetical protein
MSMLNLHLQRAVDYIERLPPESKLPHKWLHQMVIGAELDVRSSADWTVSDMSRFLVTRAVKKQGPGGHATSNFRSCQRGFLVSKVQTIIQDEASHPSISPIIISPEGFGLDNVYQASGYDYPDCMGAIKSTCTKRWTKPWSCNDRVDTHSWLAYRNRSQDIRQLMPTFADTFVDDYLKIISYDTGTFINNITVQRKAWKMVEEYPILIHRLSIAFVDVNLEYDIILSKFASCNSLKIMIAKTYHHAERHSVPTDSTRTYSR